MKTIDTSAFTHATHLQTVAIPEGVTNIGMTPFILCPSLTEITCLATTPPTLHMMAFSYLAQTDITLYVPDEAVETYKVTPTWKDFKVQPLSATEISLTPALPASLRLEGSNYWYTLDGRRLDGKPAQHGIYVFGGCKVVIK